MDPTTREDLEQFAPEWDRLVAAAGETDPFCGRSAWALAFHDAFEPARFCWPVGGAMVAGVQA